MAPRKPAADRPSPISSGPVRRNSATRSSAARSPRPRCGSAWRLLIVGVIVLAQPLLLIVGGAIFAVFLDGGARLLGRVLPIPRGWRLLLTILLGFGFIGWVFWFAGTTIAAQFEALRARRHRSNSTA